MSSMLPVSLTYAVNSLATTNGALVFAGTTRLAGVVINNASAAAKFIRFYNKLTAPTVGTDVPVLVLTVPASGSLILPATEGFVFPLGLGVAITGAAPATDSTAVAAGDVQLTVAYIPNVS